MKFFLKESFFILLILIMSNNLSASSLTGNFSFATLNRCMDVRGFAMGEIGTAYPYTVAPTIINNIQFGNSGAIWFNPAIAGGQTHKTLHFSDILPQNKFLLNTTFVVQGLFPMKKVGVFGTEFLYYYPGNEKWFDENGNEIDNFFVSDMALSFIYGNRIKLGDKLAIFLGLNIRAMTSKLVGWGVGFTGDAGVILKIKNLYIGLSGKNFGFIKYASSENFDKTAITTHAGVAYDLLFLKGAILRKILIAVDVDYSPDNSYFINGGVGTEIMLRFGKNIRFFIRLGYKLLNFELGSKKLYAGYAGLRGGLGLQINGISIDWAMGNQGVLSAIDNRISMTIRFNAKQRRKIKPANQIDKKE